MCLAKVYKASEDDKPIMEDIAYMTIDGERVEMETLFGEKKVFQGRVGQIDFLKSRVDLKGD